MMILFPGLHSNMLQLLESKYDTFYLSLQDIIDFLVENGADISIVDKTGRTAQEIGDFLYRNIDVKKKEKERKEFFLNPFEFFQNLNKSFRETQEIFHQVQKRFQSYVKNEIQDEILDEILLKKIEKTKNPEIISKLNNNSWLRGNYENNFLQN